MVGLICLSARRPTGIRPSNSDVFSLFSPFELLLFPLSHSNNNTGNAAHAAHMHEDHHGTTADPVLAAATAAAMDAAGGQEGVDEDATEAAVAVAAVLPGEEHDDDALAEAHAAAAAAHHHHSHHHHMGHHHHGEVELEGEELDHAAAAAHHQQHQIHHVVAPMVIGTKTRKNFDERLKELRKFKQKHGHANVPQKYAPNPQLGTWYVSSSVEVVYLAGGDIDLIDLCRIFTNVLTVAHLLSSIK